MYPADVSRLQAFLCIFGVLFGIIGCNLLCLRRRSLGPVSGIWASLFIDFALLRDRSFLHDMQRGRRAGEEIGLGFKKFQARWKDQ